MIKLLNIDCLKFMKGCKDNEFDLAIVDPPYGIGVAATGKMCSTSKIKYVKKNWDNEIPPPKYFKELKRISINQIVWGANYFDGVGIFGGGIVWNKLGTAIGRRKQLPSLSDCEFAYCSMRNNIKMFSYTQIGNVFGNDYQINWEQKRIHPCQKPVALYKWLLKNYAKPGDSILDTHTGSASIAIACNDMKFDLTACEIDKEYYDDGCKRLNQHQSQMTLF